MLVTSYVLYDDGNNHLETFSGPCRLAKWKELPDGWGIERFLGTVSQGMVSLNEVKEHAREIERPDYCSCGNCNQSR